MSNITKNPFAWRGIDLVTAATLAVAARSAGAAEPQSSTPGALATGAPRLTPVAMEYAAEGSITPLVCLRDGPWKYIRCNADPEMLFDLAQRNGVAIPFGNVEEIRQAYNFSNLQDFLDIYFLDLYLIHWPIALRDDVTFPTKADEMVSLKVTPLTETWEGMIAVQEMDMALHIGTSNFSIKKIKELTDATGVKPENNQVEMHPFLQQKTTWVLYHRYDT